MRDETRMTRVRARRRAKLLWVVSHVLPGYAYHARIKDLENNQHTAPEEKTAPSASEWKRLGLSHGDFNFIHCSPLSTIARFTTLVFIHQQRFLLSESVNFTLAYRLAYLAAHTRREKESFQSDNKFLIREIPQLANFMIQLKFEK